MSGRFLLSYDGACWRMYVALIMINLRRRFAQQLSPIRILMITPLLMALYAFSYVRLKVEVDQIDSTGTIKVN